MKRRLFLLLALALMSVGLYAQVLVFHLPNGEISTVAMPCTFTYSASGDKLIIDGSGTHIELQRDRILAMTCRANRGDSNGDMRVDVGDIATVISIMAGTQDGNDPDPGIKPDDPQTEPNLGNAPQGTVAVDLGLPSGTLWANMNVGATSPTDYGKFFAWGETTGYTSNTSDGRKFDWASYKWMTSGQSSWNWVNKYQVADGNTNGCWYQANSFTLEYDFVGDGLSVLLPEDDAARANWAGDWCMPTYEDFVELKNNTTQEWITFAGVSGMKFTSKAEGNTNFVFFPAAGYRYGASLYSQGTDGGYWLATVYPSYSDNARCLDFNSGGADTYVKSRCYGRSVRPVLKN
ncbi:MAG: hypothetical protein IKR50_09885 [Prevotella sp.]|nr:hypothetical protein [Prevotella sp.]